MKEVPPPITDDQELAGYRANLAQLEKIMLGHETDLRAFAAEPSKLNNTRLHLRRIYAIRQGMLDAIERYLEQQKQISQP